MRVRNSVAANRRLVLRVIAAQLLAALVMTMLFALTQGGQAARAAAVGSIAMTVGTAALGWGSLTSARDTAAAALTKLLLGIVFKWVVVIGALFSALALFGLPPLPLIAGLAGALAATFLIHKFET